MDKDFTVAHMQGKFRLTILNKKTGHNIHEDAANECS